MGEVMLLTSQTSTDADLGHRARVERRRRRAGRRNRRWHPVGIPGHRVGRSGHRERGPFGCARVRERGRGGGSRRGSVSRSATAPRAIMAAQMPRGFAATQRARVAQPAPQVSMSFTVNTRPGQTVDVRSLAREINTLQAREMKARGLRSFTTGTTCPICSRSKASSAACCRACRYRPRRWAAPTARRSGRRLSTRSKSRFAGVSSRPCQAPCSAAPPSRASGASLPGSWASAACANWCWTTLRTCGGGQS